MSTMPKKIDDELKARAVRLVTHHQGEVPTSVHGYSPQPWI
jgi:hypothetical protein